MKKTAFILLLFIALTWTTSPLVNGSEKSEEINEKDLRKKSELQGAALGNLKQIYYYNEKAKTENKESHDQFLQHTICLKLFYKSFMVYNDLLVDFDSKDIVDKYKGKKVDLYGAYYGYQCAGGTPKQNSLHVWWCNVT
ncbi:enterotoxin P, phage associated [Staphylococcus aureus]|nr:enterotoxin P, phage associated [Staphylococcus aureus]